MPVQPISTTTIRSQLDEALNDGALSSSEASSIVAQIKEDGVSRYEANEVLEAVRTLVGRDGANATGESREALASVFSALQDAALIDQGGGDTGLDGWIANLRASGALGEPVISERGFGGQPVVIDAEGRIDLGGRKPTLDLNHPSDGLMSALWGLSRGVRASGPASEGETALHGKLLSQLETSVAVSDDEPGKCRRHQAIAAALAVLARNGEALSDADAQRLLAIGDKLSTPLQKCLVARALENNANLSEETKTKLAALELPENKDEIVTQFTTIRSEAARAGFTTVKGDAAQFALSALVFARNNAAMDNIFSGMKTWDGLEGGWSSRFSSPEVAHMKAELESYVDRYPQVVYVFGTFSNEAPKLVGELKSRKAVSEVIGDLDGDAPQLNGFSLTRSQADFIKEILPNCADGTAIKNLGRALEDARAVFPTVDGDKMAPAAFEFFRKQAAQYQERTEGSETGKLDYRDFRTEFRDNSSDLKAKTSVFMRGLAGREPKLGDVALSVEAAEYLKATALNHTRSAMSIDNLTRAVEAVGKARDGKIDTATLGDFKAIVDGYRAQWPAETYFDFNKLERITTFKIDGREVPLCSLNGQTINMAEFYETVAADVVGKINRDSLRHEWMASRYAYRARQAVEILDVVGEQTLRGEGPVAELRNRFPDAEIVVDFTGKDGDHEQFVYLVKKDGEVSERFAQGSDGSLEKYRPYYKPVFTATVGSEGQLDIQTPDQLNFSRSALQITYGVGDKIDHIFYDGSAKEAQKEGEAFETRSKVLEATITGFNARGDYTVEFTGPDGELKTETVPLSVIRKANNPHWFRERYDYFSDVDIRVQDDAELKGFLDKAQPIIERHLPTDGSLANLSAAELTKRQKACIKELMDYTANAMIYPRSKDSNPDEASAKYHEFIDNASGWNRVALGELVKIERGVCRHQCILEHLLLQRAGIDSRLASGAANTSSGDFRGYHIWCEVTLADGTRFLSDQTWDDATIPLWDGAYSVDKRRIEMGYRTDRYNRNISLD